ncbi:MAG: PAS domain S-box protein [Ferruginibacter sp.]
MDQSQAILIIEDNPGDQLLLHENLKITKLVISEITIVSTLTEAINLLKQQSFTLIFLDLFLPDSSGLESFTELLKADSKTPIIISSGLSDSQIAVKAISLGAQDFLIKGDYDNKILEKTIRYSIERKRNLEIIEDSNERFNLVSKATNDMVWDWDITTGEVYRNKERWIKIFGSEDGNAALTTAEFEKRIHPDDLKKVKAILHKLFYETIGENLFEAEFRALRDDDTYAYILDRGYVIRDEEGKPLRVIGASQDITERKIAEQKVILSEQRFKSLVQNGSDIIGILDQEGNYLYLSDSIKNILGYEPEFLLGKNAFTYIHNDDQAEAKKHLDNLIIEKHLTAPPHRFLNADGQWRWMESTISYFIDDPAVQGIVVNSRDITDKKIADDEIKKLSLVAKETINGVIITDAQQRIMWVNNAFTKTCGYELEEIIGKTPGEFLYGEETEPEVIEFIREQIDKKIPFVFEILNYTKSGKTFYVRNQIQPLFDEKGGLKQYFSLLTDITQQKLLEDKVALEKIIRQKEITEAVVAAQESERSEIGRELHDNVNQLLGATRLYIDMARRDNVNRDSLLLSSSTYTLQAIDEIRKLSKTLITPLIKEIGLTDAVRNLTEDIMLVQPVKISVVVKDFTEKVFNEKFKLNVFRIVQEQLNNILKHAKANVVSINFIQTRDEIGLTIIDDGVGFDTSKRKNGVGLTNIKSRCELYKGAVLIDSEPGHGCTLSIKFKNSELLF